MDPDGDLRDMVAYWNEEIDHRRKKGWRGPLLLCQQSMGNRSETSYLVDGEQVDGFLGFGLTGHNSWSYRVHGRPWITAQLSIPESGPVGEPVCDYDRPPSSLALRRPALYASELDRRPRPSHLVPGWMKVELAVVGAWDLVRDVATWTTDGPSGEFQTPELVGVAPPPGAQWALPVEEVPRE